MKTVMKLSEDNVFLVWGVFSIAIGVALTLSPSLTSKLSEFGGFVIEWMVVFKNINTAYPFNTKLSQAHFFVTFCTFPFQVLSFAMVPNAGIASGVQNKSKTGIYWLIALFILPLLAMLGIGPVIPQRYTGMFGGTIFIFIYYYVLFISMAYLSRIGFLIVTTKFPRSDKCHQ